MKILDFFNPSLPEEEEAIELRILYRFLQFTIGICVALVSMIWFFPNLVDFPFLQIGSISILLLGLLKYTKSKTLVGNLFIGIWVYILVKNSLQTGGVYSMDTISIAFLPLMAIALIDHKSGLAWFIFYIAYIWYIWMIIDTPELDTYYRAQTLVFDKMYYVVGGIVVGAFTSGLFSIFYFQNRNLIAKLKAKKTTLKNHVSQLHEQSVLLKKTQEDLKRSNADLEEFAHVTSHDLMQPLRTVNNFAKLLEKHLHSKEINDDRSTEMLQFIVGGSNKMQLLITDLLAFAKLRKEGDLKYSKVNLENLLSSVQADLKAQIDSNDVTIENKDLPELFVIPVKMNQLFQNLISNAIKFRKKEEPLIIQIGATEHPTHWEFFVKDNGIGIDKEFQHKIFEPFKKLHHSSVYSGSGIGLATCMQIATMHQGIIRVGSTIGKGSTFFFTIAKDLEISSTDHSNATIADNSILLQTMNN